MSRVILDATAVIAVLRNERGCKSVIPHLRGSLMSCINYAELLCILHDGGGELEMDERFINSMQIDIEKFDEAHARVLANMFNRTLEPAIGFADRACLSLGMMHGLPVITANSEWLKIDIGVEVRLFREKELG